MSARDLKTILGEMSALQEKYAGKVMPQPEGEKFEALGKEAETLQKAQDESTERAKKIRDLEAKLREVPDPALPASRTSGSGQGATVDFTNTKTLDFATDPDAVIGYLKLGAAFVGSPEFKAFQAAGMPRQGVARYEAEGTSSERKGLVPVTRKMLESKAIATIGAGVIRADRQTDVIRTTEMDRLTIRDLVQKLNTGASSVDYVTVTPFTRAAAPVAESAAKPEATGTLGVGTATVRTLAVWMPVTEQQLQDVPQLQGIIDSELTYDLARLEEDQMLWGDGTGQNLLGIFPTPGVAVGRTVAGDTLVDMIRRAATDVEVGGNEPNGVIMHPLDWEAVQLTKGTDTHYLYQTFPTTRGEARVWSLRVVPTVAAANPVPAVAPTTRERRLLVGDFARGATLWDRQQTAVEVGFINDQFTRNQRTIRAEERLAFATRKPAAFKYRITQALVP